ncbi:MAG TPA: protein kinase [Polyangia bacterium]|jgi:serine/threonine protein kinase/Tol biopolymer transport system component
MERISHYRLVARLGKGAMGEVWRAVDERLGRPVALKLLPVARASEQKMQARLLREAQAASALNHPGIVTVHDVGSWHGQIFMVMELVDGAPLSELARRGIPPAEALRLVADAAEALATAHAREILHRDIKSDNLMRTHDGRIKVLDFGLAKLRAAPEVDEDAAASASSSSANGGSVHGVADLAAVAETLDSSSQSGAPASSGGAPPTNPDALRELHGAEAAHAFPALSTPSPSSSESLTMAGALVGTPVYMAPEQTEGAPGDQQSEVWSLGVVLYELLCGKRPFERALIPEVLAAIRTQPIVPPSQAAPARGVPARLDAVVLKALARDRSVRYADMRAFAAALKQARRRLGGVNTSGEAALPSTPRVWAVGAALVAFACIVGGWAFFGRHPAPPPPPKPEPPSVTVTGTRRITFDVGCEEYPSFTPDGKTVVFDGVMENDYELLALDIASGTTGRLTHEPGWDYGGAVSPDGKSIAYVHTSDDGREIRVLPIEGDRAIKPERLGLAASGFPSWTHDGAVIVGEGDEILRWTIEPKGVKKETLAHLPSGAVGRYVAQFADGNIVALWQPQYAANVVVVGELPRGGAPRAVETLPLDSIGLVVAPSQVGYYYGRHHANANELVRRKFGGGAAETVPGDVTPASGLSISPDGKHLAYSTCRESSVIARLRPGKPPEQLMAAGNWRDIWPAPVDERRVAFQSDRAGAVQVWIYDVKTHESRPLAGASSSNPAVSPDGKWLAYGGGAEPGIHVAPVGGGAATRVTDSADDGEPAFSFDGKTLVFESTRQKGGARVYAVAVGGGAVRAISPAGALSPAASPTEDRVVFVLPTEKGRVLMSTTLDGRAPAPLAASLAAGDWLNPRFSRDGKKLLAVRKTAEVVEIELATGATRVVYEAGLDGIGEATYAPDGDGLIASVQLWSGDLWLADGTFR